MGYLRNNGFTVPMPLSGEEICLQSFGVYWNKVIVINEGHSITHSKKLKSSVNYAYDVETGDLIGEASDHKKLRLYFSKK